MSKMRNITGNPVENDDFFDRPRDLARLRRELENDANFLITAPRRVGKTSLVLRLCAQMRTAGWTAVFINIEGCQDELSFAEKLVEELKSSGLQPELLARVSLLFRGARKAISGAHLSAAGVDMSLGQGATEDPNLRTLGHALESIFRHIEASGTRVLLVIDEMPELLLAIGAQTDGPARIAHLLHWLRALRQTHRRLVRWVFLGSIGLDTFVDDRQLRKTINDLTPLAVEALTLDEADAFLARLGTDNALPIPPAQRQEILARVGWPLPHHLQLVFHVLRDSEARTVDSSAVARAFDHLFDPCRLGELDTWRQRLIEQFNAADSAAARDILRHLCARPDGGTRADLIAHFASIRPAADPGALDEQIARLLLVLQRDGYLLLSAKPARYAFRSFLLREYWHRRELR